MVKKKLSLWGESVWEEKIKKQDEKGVIHGGRFSKSDKITDGQVREVMMFLETKAFKGLKKNAKVMDAGVGPLARHSIELSKRGYNVTGIDVSKTTIEYAKKHSVEANIKMQFIKDDLTLLKNVKDKFDFVFCFGTFGHIPKILALDTLRNFNSKLNKNGLCFIHFWIEKKKTPFDIMKDFFYMIVHKIRIGSGKSFKVNCSFYSPEEIKEMMERSGFKIIDRKNDFFLLEKIN